MYLENSRYFIKLKINVNFIKKIKKIIENVLLKLVESLRRTLRKSREFWKLIYKFYSSIFVYISSF